MIIDTKIRKILIIAGSIFAITALIAIILTLLTKDESHKITFEFGDEVKVVKISQDNGANSEPTELGEVSSENPKMNLENGEYYYTPTNEDYTGNYFFVDDNTETVQVDVSYSEKYYEKMEKYKSQLDKILAEKYPKTYSGSFELRKITSYENENYISAIIVNKDNIRNFYRVLFEKDGNTYKLMSDPQIYFYQKEFEKVPGYILDLANKATAY